jgi:hypothetical protein
MAVAFRNRDGAEMAQRMCASQSHADQTSKTLRRGREGAED